MEDQEGEDIHASLWWARGALEAGPASGDRDLCSHSEGGSPLGIYYSMTAVLKFLIILPLNLFCSVTSDGKMEHELWSWIIGAGMPQRMRGFTSRCLATSLGLILGCPLPCHPPPLLPLTSGQRPGYEHVEGGGQGRIFHSLRGGPGAWVTLRVYICPRSIPTPEEVHSII